jgi:hypothetical protein
MEMNYQNIQDKHSNCDSKLAILLERYNQDTYNDYIEESKIKRPMKIPKFISEPRGKFEKSLFLMLCCFAKFKSLDKISQEELNAYYRLKEIAILTYNEHDEDHENSLKNLFISALNVDLSDNLESVEWKTIGFQVL